MVQQVQQQEQRGDGRLGTAQDVAQDQSPPGKAVEMCDTHPIPAWQLLLTLLQPLHCSKERKQTLHSLAQRSAPGGWHQGPCSVIRDHTESFLILQIILLKSKLRGFQ